MLWLCIHLPQLPLDALRAGPPEQATAVLDDAGRHILHANAAAQAQGIHPGLTAGSAQALHPPLRCLPRQPGAEARALDSLAAWSLRFTSWVSPAPPQDVLLEIGASLALFGPATRLRERIRNELEPLGYGARLGIAPTPRGAQALARADIVTIANDRNTLEALLRPLPLDVLWETSLCRRIRGVGVRNIGEALALPRGGFNQRYGATQGRILEQLLGQLADPRPAHRPPRRYRRQLDAAQETRDYQALLPGFERLFRDLAATLQGHDCSLTQLHVQLCHARTEPTRLTLGLRTPSRDPERWLSLLQEHFQRLEIAEEVRAIGVEAGDFLEPCQPQTQLWRDPTSRIEDRQALLEHLAARLGPSSLYGLSSCPSHAPETAWQQVEAGQGADRSGEQRPRPLWLLAEPQPISTRALQRLSSAERLETRWWAQDCRRDYYHARDSQGRRLWVFRSHDAPDQWFVHGIFG